MCTNFGRVPLIVAELEGEVQFELVVVAEVVQVVLFLVQRPHDVLNVFYGGGRVARSSLFHVRASIELKFVVQRTLSR